MGRLQHVTFAGGDIDRAAHRRREPGLLAALLADPLTRVIDLGKDGFLVDAAGGLALRAPRAGDVDAPLVVFLGQQNGPGGQSTAYVVIEPSDAMDRPTAGLRELAAALDDDTAALVATSLGLANWHRTHPRCSLCGVPTEPDLAGWIRRCPQDGSEHFPRTDVAVIMAVTDGDDRLLLGRAPSWPEGRMSILAGFVEPGETLEQAVAREVREEVGIDVHDVEYVDDQPWPFPSSLMVGFTARADQTALALDPTEMAEARWVSRTEVADLIAAGEYRPSPALSISRALVEDWYGGPLPTRRGVGR